MGLVFGQKGKTGMALIAAIMLMVFVSIAVSSITVFIVQRLSQTVPHSINIRCIYLAQAGLHNALNWYRSRGTSGYFNLGRSSIDSSNYFVLGTTVNSLADFLMVDSSTAALGGTGTVDLLNLRVKKACDNTKTLSIGRMYVSWVKTGAARNLTVIRIGNSNKWSGSSASPADCDITNTSVFYTFSSINYLRFNGDMTGTSSITIQFIMTDGSSKTVTAYPASTDNFYFTLKSTGKTTGFNIYRTTEMVYNASTAKITSYKEVSSEIVP